jgi:hypothetical protein
MDNSSCIPLLILATAVLGLSSLATATTITYDISFNSQSGVPGGTGSITFDAASIKDRSMTPILESFSASIDGYLFDTSSLLYDGCGNPPGTAFLCDAIYGRRGELRGFFLSVYATNYFQLDLAIFDAPKRDPSYLMYITGGPDEGIVDEGRYTLTKTPEPGSLALVGPLLFALALRRRLRLPSSSPPILPRPLRSHN